MDRYSALRRGLKLCVGTVWLRIKKRVTSGRNRGVASRLVGDEGK